jgi:UDP-glucuronate decarboxylase
MNVVITACNGFIGRALVKRLHHNYRILGLCSHPFPLPEHPDIRSLNKPISELTTHDAANFFDGEEFAVVHLAWHSPREHDFAVAANTVRDMSHLLQVTKTFMLKFVSLGSADEFGTTEGKLSANMQYFGLLSPYGWGKRCAASLLSSFSAGALKPAFWLRPFTVYGENQHGSMVIPYAVACARGRLDAYFSDCLQERDFIHVDDVADAIQLAMTSEIQGFKMLNLGWGEPVQLKAVILDIGQRMGAASLFRFGALNRRPDEPMTRYADIADASSILNWSPRVQLSDGLHRIVTSAVDEHLATYANSRRSAHHA